MPILMAMGEVVKQANDAELVSLAANQGNSASLMNPMDPLGIIEDEEYISPVCPCPDVNVENLRIDDSHPFANRKTSPLHGMNMYNNNRSNEVLDEHPPLQPKQLFNTGESPQTRECYIQTNEERANPQQAFGAMSSHRIANRYSFHEFSDGASIQQFQSPDTGPRRHAWSDTQQRYLQNEGYNSDSDILKNSSRSKKSSWDQPSSSGGQGKAPEYGNQFVKSHRRVKSGDAAAGFYVNNSRYQPSHTPQNFRPPFMSHSQSQGNISIPHPEQRIPVLNHQPVSVDTSVSSRDLVHQHLCHQSTAFVRLQAAIADASKEAERLEREVEDKLFELNAGLNVKQNPTQKECDLLEAENNYLTTEIQAMYHECDRLGVPVPGDSPSTGENPGYHTNPPGPRYPTSPGDTPITVQPRSNKQKRSNSSNNYENILTYTTSKSDGGEASKIINTSSPPPIPPRIPQKPVNEHWVCPKCTFNNLLVSDCEICLTPRPTSLR